MHKSWVLWPLFVTFCVFRAIGNGRIAMTTSSFCRISKISRQKSCYFSQTLRYILCNCWHIQAFNQRDKYTLCTKSETPSPIRRAANLEVKVGYMTISRRKHHQTNQNLTWCLVDGEILFFSFGVESKMKHPRRLRSQKVTPHSDSGTKFLLNRYPLSMLAILFITYTDHTDLFTILRNSERYLDANKIRILFSRNLMICAWWYEIEKVWRYSQTYYRLIFVLLGLTG